MLSEELDGEIERRMNYSLRRLKGIPNDRRLWVLTCMDERVHVEEVLGIKSDDAHIYRNAGGIVTDDAIRSAALTTNFFGTKEIIVITHTDCGMLRFSGDEVAKYFLDKGVNIKELQIDPLLPSLRIQSNDDFIRWFKFFKDLGANSPDDIAVKNVEILRNHILIPKNVTITAYVYEVENHRLRKPHQRIYDMTSRFEHGTIVKE
ncbi:MAG: carbonic anhydrase [Saccharolobus sp.]